MAQSGYTPIQVYRSATASAVPAAGNLAVGELAVNTVDMKLFFKNASGVVQALMNNPAALVYPTADGSAGQVISTDGAGTLTFADAVLKTSSTGSAVMPTGTTAERDGSPQEGYFRRNSELGQWEGYDGSQWGGLGGASGGGGNPFVYENDQTVTADYTLTSGKHGMSAGPITIDSGVTVTVPAGSNWIIV